jgi:hypothetical protein
VSQFASLRTWLHPPTAAFMRIVTILIGAGPHVPSINLLEALQV